MGTIQHHLTLVLILWISAFVPLSPAVAQAQVGQSAIVEFDASSSTPITTVEIDGKEVRFALDPLLGPYVTINPRANRRLRVQTIWDNAIIAKVDEAQIKGALGRATLKAGVLAHDVESVLIRRPHWPRTQAETYDVAGGFEALPGTKIIVHLNRNLTGPMRRIQFARKRLDVQPGFPIEVADTPMRVNFQFASTTTWLERRAALALINEGLVRATGEISVLPVWYGLDMPVQRLETIKPLTLKGIPLNDLEARTDESLIAPEPNENVIIVQNWKDAEGEPSILLGTDSLKACARMEYDKRRRRLTLICPK